ncbi:MAG: 16S rRNA (uracil(1498)-N(3))-methyltransferase, partial [Thermoanaerobaculia bacterium]|nr:16S rRNA (uracil(1498)-N(3))-methyltransferase [Thermoanaerobaculia bacterium]
MTATLVVSPAELIESEVQVEGDSYRHLFRARRLAVGDSLRLVDGQGAARNGRIETVDRRRAVISVGSVAPSLESAVDLTLWVAAPKMDRASWLVEKATELGVARVAFVRFLRSSRDLEAEHLERLRRIAVAAVGQCGRSVVPQISAPRGLHEAVAGFGPKTYLLDPRASTGGFPEAVSCMDLVVGPEGGLETEELECLTVAAVVPVNLGDRILRIETAAVAGAA